VVRELAAGRVVLLTDQARGEAALLASAGLVTPETLVFLIRNSEGIVSAPMRAERLDQLRIPPQLGGPSATSGRPGLPEPAVSVDLRKGVSTGISARDRAATLRALANPRTIAPDLVRPGHVAPIRCSAGGVLDHQRLMPGALDLCVLAGCGPCAAVAELAESADGRSAVEVAGRMAPAAGLVAVDVSDVARHRRVSESHVGRGASTTLPTVHGEFQALGYDYDRDGSAQLVLYVGNIASDDVLVRVHAECITGDALGSRRCRCAQALDASLQIIGQRGRGVVVYLRERGRAGVGMAHIVEGCGVRDERDETIAAHILRDLGVRSAILLTDRPDGPVGPTGFGLTVSRRIAVLG
jgi:3,4-dihydroxy 2-butanone 4-phosphate synthase/GTP cyclohydrolase II